MDSENITQLLIAASEGDPAAMDEVFASVYPRLRELAKARRRHWAGNLTMNTTGLVHEAYLKVAGSSSSQFTSRGHFFAVASKAMRQVLINYAEKQRAAKRGGDAAHVTLSHAEVASDGASEDLLSLEDALKKLEKLSERQAQVVECLFFGGLGIAEAAEALSISPATVKRDWSAARAWLYRAMHDGDATPGLGPAS